MTCKTWSILSRHFRPLCSMEFKPDRGITSCNVCASPVPTDPPLNCFDCTGEWPGTYRISGLFEMSGTVTSGEVMNTGENDTYRGERNAYSFPWTWAQINGLLTDGVLVSASESCAWCMGMTSLVFCRASEDFLSTVASCGAELNHKALRESWVLDSQLYRWPMWLRPYTGGEFGQQCYKDSSVSVGGDYAANTSSPFGAKYDPDISGRWPSGYGVLTGTIPAASISVTIGAGQVITNQPLFPSCPSAQEVTFSTFRNKWKGLFFTKKIQVTLKYVSSKIKLTIDIDHGGIPIWENWQRKSTGVWRKPDFPTGVTITDPAIALTAARPGSGHTYTQDPDCNNKTRIKMLRQAGTNYEGWPDSLYLIAGT